MRTWPWINNCKILLKYHLKSCTGMTIHLPTILMFIRGTGCEVVTHRTFQDLFNVSEDVWSIFWFKLAAGADCAQTSQAVEVAGYAKPWIFEQFWLHLNMTAKDMDGYGDMMNLGPWALKKADRSSPALLLACCCFTFVSCCCCSPQIWFPGFVNPGEPLLFGNKVTWKQPTLCIVKLFFICLSKIGISFALACLGLIKKAVFQKPV